MGASPSEVSSANVLSQITVTEKLKDAGSATDKTVTPDSFNPGQSSYSQTSTVPVKYYSSQTLALVGGAATIDLTSLPGLQAAIDATGLKVQAFRIQGRAGNGALTISPGAANPYAMFGAGNSIVYPAGCTLPWQFEFGDKLADVAAGAKEIDLSGTGTEVFDIEFLLG